MKVSELEPAKIHFDNIRKRIDDGETLSAGTLKAYWTYQRNLDNHIADFECDDLPATADMKDFVNNLRLANIHSIVITETSTFLQDELHQLVYCGCTFGAFCTVLKPIFTNRVGEVPGIRMNIY